jgi:hypothetical protein
LSALAALGAVLCTWDLLVGFFRALITELAWRRQFSAFRESSASFFEECAALAGRVGSTFAALHRIATQRTETHSAAPCVTAVPEPSRIPTSFALLLFGVYNGTATGGYLWNEKDAIE